MTFEIQNTLLFTANSNFRPNLIVILAREQRPDATDAAFTSNGNNADYKLVRQEISELISANPAKGPTLVRLAWHSSGTYDKMLNDGGSSKGTIRFKEELVHGANAGLDTATMWLEPIYRKVISDIPYAKNWEKKTPNRHLLPTLCWIWLHLQFNRKTDLTYADLYTLAGAEAISAMGGPKIPWRSGRVDSLEASDVTPDGRLPEADKGNPMATWVLQCDLMISYFCIRRLVVSLLPSRARDNSDISYRHPSITFVTFHSYLLSFAI